MRGRKNEGKGDAQRGSVVKGKKEGKKRGKRNGLTKSDAERKGKKKE